jgi:4-alpha-glucanotransferase
MDSDLICQIEELARLLGLQAEYYDGLGQFRKPSVESIFAVLKSLRRDLVEISDVPACFQQIRNERTCRPMEPVSVAWEKGPRLVHLNIPSRNEGATLELSVQFETGGQTRFSLVPGNLNLSGGAEWDGEHYQIRDLPVPPEWPCGYHRVRLNGPGIEAENWLITAPEQAHQPGRPSSWGVFLPVYALHSRSSWGAGDFTDFGAFMEWVSERGGHLVGTLPLVATFLDEPFAPSPYSPISRRFWSEFFVDPLKAPNWQSCPEAKARIDSPSFQAELSELRRSPQVEYRQQMKLKREILRILSDNCRTKEPGSRRQLEDFVKGHPDIERYASFRTTVERLGANWRAWPEPLRGGGLAALDREDGDYFYHLYAQWLTQLQAESLLSRARAREVGLYLDLPLGVHPDGFDAWDERESFAEGVSGGSPPDGFFTEGQDWGFQPLHPEQERHTGYRYFRSVLGHMMNNCDMLRIDHAMSLQRLFWVPHGRKATDGVYVHYPSEELFAVVALESSRHSCTVVGEDLGTVTPEIREKMRRHGVLRMYVGQFDFNTEQAPPFNRPGREMVASLNTHDTATAAGFWHGDDIELRHELGLLEGTELDNERHGRAYLRERFQQHLGITGDPLSEEVQSEVLRRWLAFLAESDAVNLLITLEDLFNERRPQNVPGTVDEKPNWRGRTRLSLEEFSNDARVLEILEMVNRLRS